jgi:hypothetical protein
VCTGVGRQGKEVKLPGYERSHCAHPHGCRSDSAGCWRYASQRQWQWGRPAER